MRPLQTGQVNYWTGGEGREFEREYAAHLGVRHTVAVSNGTVALELILRALDIAPGDEVIVPSRTFVATASTVLWSGATPVFADVTADSGSLSAATIAPHLTPRTRAIIVVHIGGWPCAMDEIMALATSHGLTVIEDCAQAHGARYRGKPIGAIGHVSAFSFCQDKIITTGGEGGLIATDDAALWGRLWSLKDHGKSHAAMLERKHPAGFRWVHNSLGTNARITEMQAAIGRVALRALPEWISRRQTNAAVYAEVLEDLEALAIPRPPEEVTCSYYRFYFRVRAERLHPDWSRDRMLEELTRAGWPVFAGSCSEIYREAVFQSCRPLARHPQAAQWGEDGLCLLTHPTLEAAHCRDIARAVAYTVRAATR